MTSFLGIRKGIIMPVDERNLEVIVNDLIKDVNTHANQIAAIQTDLARMTSDMTSVRDLLIKNTERSDVLIGDIKGQSDEMLKLLTDGERSRNESRAFTQKQVWGIAAAIVAGLGSIITTILTAVLS
ncbi:hypothetical protein KKKDEHFA_00106 [Enterococcus phage EF_TR2]